MGRVVRAGAVAASGQPYSPSPLRQQTRPSPQCKPQASHSCDRLRGSATRQGVISPARGKVPSSQTGAKIPHGPVIQHEVPKEVQDLTPMPATLEPICVVRPQGLASQHAFTAMNGGAVACISGSCAAFCYSDGTQTLRFGTRMRRFSCCALSPCSRYLAVGESCCTEGDAQASSKTHIIVFDVRDDGSKTVLHGHPRGTSMLAWSQKGAITCLLSISSAGGNRENRQMVLWLWPKGERLASVAQRPNIVDVCFSPERLEFCTATQHEAKLWKLAESCQTSAKKLGADCGFQKMPLDVNFGPGASSLKAGEAGENIVSMSWGCGGWIYFLAQSGRVGAIQPAGEGRYHDLARPASVIVWAEDLCGRRPGTLGLLACAISDGTVEILNAESFQVEATLTVGDAAEAVGLSYSVRGEALWVLHSDKKLSRWRSLTDGPDRELPAPIDGTDCAQSIPNSCLSQLVTHGTSGYQLWTVSPDGLRLDCNSEETAISNCNSRVSAFAASERVVASGRTNGEIEIFSVSDLRSLDRAVRHKADVLDVSFASSVPFSHASLLLLSASQDRSLIVYRLDLQPSQGEATACRVTVLWQLTAHPAGVQFAAFMGSKESNTVLALTADKQLLAHDLDVVESDGIPRQRCVASLPRNSHWIGTRVDARRRLVFAACTDRRILRVETPGHAVAEQLRLGGQEFEFTAPLRLSDDGQLLAVGLAAGPPRSTVPATGNAHLFNAVTKRVQQIGGPQGRWARSAAACGTSPGSGVGVLLIDAGESFMPLARLVGHSEAPCGTGFLGSDRIVACWPDGVTLMWKATRSRPSLGSVCDVGSSMSRASSARFMPLAEGIDSLAPAAVPVRAATASPRQKVWPNSQPCRLGSPRGASATVVATPAVAGTQRSANSARGQTGRESPARTKARPGVSKDSVTTPSLAGAAGLVGYSRSGSAQVLNGTSASQQARRQQQSLAQGCASKVPEPQRGAGRVADPQLPWDGLGASARSSTLPCWARSSNGSASARRSGDQPHGFATMLVCESRSSLDSCSNQGPRRRLSASCGRPSMGKWARNSQVGSRVLSASDLHAVLSLEEGQPKSPEILTQQPVNWGACVEPLRTDRTAVADDRTVSHQSAVVSLPGPSQPPAPSSQQMRSSPPVAWSQPELPLNSKRARSGIEYSSPSPPAARSCSLSNFSASAVRAKLPPMPSSPAVPCSGSSPKGCDGNPANVLEMPVLSLARARGLATPCRGNRGLQSAVPLKERSIAGMARQVKEESKAVGKFDRFTRDFTLREAAASLEENLAKQERNGADPGEVNMLRANLRALLELAGERR